MKSFEVIQNIPSPYRLHMFNVLWHELELRGYAFHVNFMSEGHAERPDSWRHPKIDFPHSYWKDYGYKSHHFNPGLIAYLRRVAPDVILAGSPFDTFTSICASYLCPARIKCTWLEGNTKTPGRMGGLLGWFKREVISHYQLVGVPGRDAAAYIALHQALTKKKMPSPVYLPNLVDENRFKSKLLWTSKEQLATRARYGIPADSKLCLIPARLEPVKGLIELFSSLTPELLQGWKIMVMGQGSLHGSICDLLKERGIEDFVVMQSYVPYDEMPAVYGAADLFLLPSLYDPNPLSVVEALHTGLPVALSNMVGNVEEAVNAGENGWVLPVKDTANMQHVLADVFLCDKKRLEQLGRNSVSHAEFWNSSVSVKNFLDGLLTI